MKRADFFYIEKIVRAHLFDAIAIIGMPEYEPGFSDFDA
jgi:hypothetical protein